MYLSKLNPLSKNLYPRRIPQYPIASRNGYTELKIMVYTRVAPTNLNHLPLKSGISPDTSPNENGYSLQLTLTMSKRKAVLKN